MKELPEGWEWKKLGEVCQAITGTTPPKDNLENYGVDIPFVKPPQLFDKPINDAPEKLSQKGATLARILPIHSVLVTCIGNLGRTAINNVPVAFNQQINALIPLSNLDGKFLFYQAQSPVFKNQLEKLASATTVAIVNKRKFETIQIPLPPLLVQQAIVTKIEAIFSELDHGVEQLKLAQQQLKVYRQSVLKWVFEGRLTNAEVKDGELVEGWKWVKISELCNVVRGGSPRPAGDPRYYDGDIPFLKVADLTNDSNIFLYKFKHTIKQAGLHKTRKIQPNTLLLSNSGATLGVPKICMIEATMNDGIAAFLGLDERMNLFLYYFWLSKTEELRNINMGAAQPNLNTDIIKNYAIPLPPLSEQHQIVAEIERRLSVCDKLEETIVESLKAAEVLRAGVLKRAFEGRLV